MLKKHRFKIQLLLMVVILVVSYQFVKRVNINPNIEVGEPIDSLDGVMVYFNGGVGNIEDRRVVDGYNLGLNYQCVEFVKRYYFEHYEHRMPDTYGHAKSFFQKGLADGQVNEQRDLVQYSNPSSVCPEKGDLIVYGPSLLNRYGHVAIISSVLEGEVEIIQQNPGPFGASRELIELTKSGNNWRIENDRVLGWLRKN